MGLITKDKNIVLTNKNISYFENSVILNGFWLYVITLSLFIKHDK